MEPTRELIDQLYREEVRRAREMPPADKLIAGARLFDRACRLMMDGIRDEYPDADEATVRRILNERLELARRLERRSR
jgi:hypothetical protein